MHLPHFRASVTCVRVPVYRAHSVAISAEFERPVSVAEAHEVLAKAPGLELVDEPQRNSYPMPLFTAGKDNCEVGRVRLDCAFENGLVFLGFGRSTAQGRRPQRGADRRAALKTNSPGFLRGCSISKLALLPARRRRRLGGFLIRPFTWGLFRLLRFTRCRARRRRHSLRRGRLLRSLRWGFPSHRHRLLRWQVPLGRAVPLHFPRGRSGNRFVFWLPRRLFGLRVGGLTGLRHHFRGFLGAFVFLLLVPSRGHAWGGAGR